jgi:hypothetical protein
MKKAIPLLLWATKSNLDSSMQQIILVIIFLSANNLKINFVPKQ